MLNAILPVFLLICIGYALKKVSIFQPIFWEETEKLAYYVLFPALLINKMSVADLSQVELIPLASTLWLALAMVSIIGLLLKSFLLTPILNISNASFTSIYQGSIRFNTYIGLALVSNLFASTEPSNSALSTAVIIAAILIPVVNLLVVIILQCYAKQKNASATTKTAIQNLCSTVLKICIQISKNPLIIGCIIGISLNVSGLTLASSIQDTIGIIGSTALPIGLMTVGAALLFDHFKSSWPAIAIASLIKLTLFPSIAYTLSLIFGLDQQTRQIVVIFCALPTASAAYILAKNMAGDHQLMATLITCQTLLSSLSLLLVLTLLGLH